MSALRMSVKDFQILFDVNIPSRETCKSRVPVTENQKTFLHDAGLNVTGITLKSQATVIIKEINRRKKFGLCDVKTVMLMQEARVRHRTPYRVMTQKHAFQLLSRRLYP